MGIAKLKRFLAEQQRKCDHILNEVAKINLFGDFDNSMERLHLSERYYNLTEANATVNEIDTKVEISPCSPIAVNHSCWTLSPGMTVLSCPIAWSMGHNLTSNNLRNLSSKICLANSQRFQNVSGSFWSLCTESSTFYTFDDRRLKYSRDLVEELSKWLRIIRIMSLIGYTTSLITLIVAMVIFSSLRKLWNPRNKLHMHLFASFIMRAFTALLKYWIFIDGIGLSWDFFIDGKIVFIKETWVCKLFTSLWQYSIIANYSWILMEGLYLHNLIVLALCSNSSPITLYILLGWGLPGLVVVPWIVTRATIEDTLCWTTHDNPSLFRIIRIPIMISILFNFVLFLNIVRMLFVKLKTSVYLQHKKMQYKKWTKSTMVLVPLFGAHYTLFLELSYYIDKDYRIELIWMFCDQLFASFQGTFVALLYCLLNSEVRAEMFRTWKTRRSKWYVDSFNSGHRELLKNLKSKTSRKRCRSEGDNGSSNSAGTAMRELSLP
ncbi:PREDICTED: secretin receptor-like [Dinoponera quadriceps]|uniref:Secretin receptor-like n=1 Tax=Dinoponera quadriceps TaxID=609295 RepID=A0A6P3YDL0_DINQU|nr:PREDICTED: secretin receptor-like [Dinoponera quadriceps]